VTAWQQNGEEPHYMPWAAAVAKSHPILELPASDGWNEVDLHFSTSDLGLCGPKIDKSPIVEFSKGL
jgi:hypothetical protein